MTFQNTTYVPCARAGCGHCMLGHEQNAGLLTDWPYTPVATQLCRARARRAAVCPRVLYWAGTAFISANSLASAWIGAAVLPAPNTQHK